MANYLEIRDLFNDSDLKNRVEVAVIVAAQGLADSPDNNAWVAEAYNNPKGEAQKALMGVLAQNRAFTVAQIQGADDATLQTAVDAAVATLVKAKAGL